MSDIPPLMGCMRCADGPAGMPGSDRGICVACGHPVWFDPNLAETLAQRFGQPPTLQCVHCPRGDRSIWVDPEQVAEMIAMGRNPFTLALVVALSEVGAGEPPDKVTETILEAVERDPTGPLAQQFNRALLEATRAVEVAIGLLQRRN